jgi:glucose-6-phosphate dehydrogenase assembly protein OpcA
MEAAVTPTIETVKPDAILHELAELWNNMTKPQPGEAPEEYSSGSLRACAMTLNVFVNEEDDPAGLDKTLEIVMHSHPNRAIVVRLREDSGTLTSRVSSRCWMPVGHHREVCCEVVELSASLNRLVDIPGIVGPLAAPDVPRVVWFRSARLESAPGISELLTLGDKLIVDSERPGAPTFADLRVLSGAGYLVADLAWTRLTRLRQLAAQLCEDYGPGRIRNVLVQYSGAEPSAGARYMQAWLRSGLPDAEVDLRPGATTGKGEIMQISVDGSDTLSRTTDPSACALAGLIIKLQRGCAEYEMGTMRQRANLAGGEDHDLLGEELGIMSRDQVYERALQRMSVWTPRS